MSKRYSGAILILVMMLMIPLQGWAATPKETVESGVNKVTTTLGDPAFKEWKKMNAGQQKEFVQLFRKLLQNVYADRLLAYSDQKVLFDKETMLKKGRAEVQSYLQTSDGKKIPLFYRLTDKSGSWKVYDVIIEGVSMVKNYRTQFREILAKDSPEKLLQILRDKTSKS